jgi:hypothetical protein
VRIGDAQDLFIPTRFFATSDIMHGDDELESYIIDKGFVRYAPSYNLDLIKERNGGADAYKGWCWSSGIVGIGMTQYIVVGLRQGSHGTQVEASKSQIRMYPIEWITYDSYNTSGDVG